MKKILVSFAVVVVLVGTGIGFLVSRADEIVRQTVEKIGGQATRTEVVLKSVELDMVGGKAQLSGLTVGNPTGFGTPNAFSLDGIAVTLDVGSVTSDAIRVPSIVIDAPKVTYEWAASGSNIDVIQKNVDAFAKAMSGGSSEEDGGRKLIIDRLVIKDAGVSVSADFLGGKKMGGVLPTITLTDIGTSSGGATPGEVATKVISSITSATTGLITDLGVGDLAKGAMDAAKGVLEGAAGVGDATKSATEGLKNMFGN